MKNKLSYQASEYDCGPTTVMNAIGHPKRWNRKVTIARMNEEGKDYYALGEIAGREAMLIYNINTRKTPEKSIEYFI